MSSCPKGGERHLSFTPKTPNFYRIIYEENQVTEKLSIPRRFIRKFGKDLSSTVVLESPCDKKWEVQLSNSDDRTWLDDGWKEFADYYSLGLGNLLVFKYEGGSKFSVLLFDKSATSVEYTACRPNNQHMDSDQGEEVHEPSSPVPPSDPESPGLTKTKVKRTRPRKMKSKTTVGIRRSARILKGKESSSEKLNQSHSATAASKALEAARNFISSYPFFRVVINISQKASNVNIPLEFVMEHIKPKVEHVKQRVSKLDVKVLCNDNEWPVTLNIYHRYGGQGKLSAGWPQFVNDNSLELRDVCVFELISNDPLRIRVSIFKHSG